MTPQEELLRILVLRSYLREAGRQFRLASGRLSDYYIECSLTKTYHAAAPLIGALIHAVRKCGEEGLRVLGAVALVDREEDDGRARVEAALASLGATFHALFTRTELEYAWRTGRQ